MNAYSVRILVMLGTAALGDTAALMSRGPTLPGFVQASRAVEVRTGMRLMDAAAGAERVIMSIPEGTLRVVLPANVVSMTAGKGNGGPPASSGGGTPKGGRLLPSGHRAFKSFDDFKDFMGPAGKDRQWHHIVEQHQGNLWRFGPEALHNTENVISIDGKIHVEISRFYSSRQGITGNKVVREWLRTQSYEQQRTFGLMVLKRFGVIP